MQRRHFLSSTAAILGGSLVPPAWAAAPKKLRVAVVGHTGRGDYGHGIDTMWLGLPETELVGVADADGKGLAAALKKLHLTQGFSNYVEMLADLRPDILPSARGALMSTVTWLSPPPGPVSTAYIWRNLSAAPRGSR
ncbi:MAG: hypothetical protein R3F31_24540 [Verrucomicrobiales bacterium]